MIYYFNYIQANTVHILDIKNNTFEIRLIGKGLIRGPEQLISPLEDWTNDVDSVNVTMELFETRDNPIEVLYL